ncbi:MAG TPA: FAD-dependent oxidoreductase, partial [Chthonomonadaceae bacterium]|nr:FAD-dependent oxidoreductase [Chthonomonadaceae bacterium]
MSAEPGGDTIDCDVLVAGASAGGTAAALAAAESGLTVCLTEETDWLGGQLTVQGVCTPDENRYIESLGCTRRYAAFRAAVRGYYRENYRLSEAARGQQFLNPGSCWVSGLSFEPKVGAVLLANMLAPQQAAGRLRIFFRTRVTACTMDRDRPEWIAEAAASCDDGTALRIRPRFVLDGTDCGDLLPMCGEEGPDWVIGAESCADTGEPDAPAERRADWVQPITFPFAIDWSPETAPTNLVAPPADYAELRELQRYHIKHGAITGLFAGRAPWWTYRRFLAAVNFDDPRIPADVAMINTAGNDYYGGSILGSDAGDAAQQAATLARARRAALGYLYWLQTECPREDGDGIGYPEFRLRRDVFGTEDGCALRPY